MGMTIDDAIRELQSQKRYYQDFWGADANDYVVEMFDVAIDTMRKYQTMQEVLEKVWNVPSCMLDEAECLNEIMETYRTVR